MNGEEGVWADYILSGYLDDRCRGDASVMIHTVAVKYVLKDSTVLAALLRPGIVIDGVIGIISSQDNPAGSPFDMMSGILTLTLMEL